MPSLVVWMAAAGAFALPALGVLIRLDSPSRRIWVRPALLVGSGLFLVWAVNLGSPVWGPSWSPTTWFIAMNLGFLGTAGAGLGALLVAMVLTQVRHRGPILVGWGALTLVLWLVGLYRSLLMVSDAGTAVFRYGEVFTFGTLDGAGAVALTCALLFFRGNQLDPKVRRGRWAVVAILGILTAWSTASDVGDLDRLWWGLDLPLSPFFLTAAASLVYVLGWMTWTSIAPAEVPEDQESWVRSRGISDRERQVLDLLVAGVDRALVAERLFISPVTVKNHLAALYRKTGTSDLATLTALVRRIRAF